MHYYEDEKITIRLKRMTEHEIEAYGYKGWVYWVDCPTGYQSYYCPDYKKCLSSCMSWLESTHDGMALRKAKELFLLKEG